MNKLEVLYKVVSTMKEKKSLKVKVNLTYQSKMDKVCLLAINLIKM